MSEIAASPLATRLRPALSWHRSLIVFAAANAVMAIVALGGVMFDDRLLNNEPIWLKPLKFAVSFVLFGTTLAWMISRLQRRRRLGHGLGHFIVLTGVIEMLIIVGQVVRGQQSHFNTTTALDGLLWTIMGSTIVLLWVATLIVAVLLLREPIGDRALTVSIRLGMVVALVGMAVAFFMTPPNPAQQKALAQGQTTTTGAHSVGVPDGGPGLPGTGWSTTGGDLRAAHFIGMHALQGLPLLALALGALGARGGRLHDERLRMGLAAVAAGAWLGLTALLTWQALRGQPLLAPDGLTLTVLGALLLATAIGIAVVLRAGSRPSVEREAQPAGPS